MKSTLNSRPEVVGSANRYAGQLKMLRPERSWEDCKSQAFQETYGCQRNWKVAGGRVVTHQRLRAIQLGQADMREKPVIIGDLTELMNFSIA